MHYILIIIATLLLIFWLFLLFRIKDEDWIQAAYGVVFDNHQEVKKRNYKNHRISVMLNQFNGTMLFMLEKIYSILNKKTEKPEKKIHELHDGNFKSVPLSIMPGYVLQREFSAIGKGNIHKIILSRCFELYGKKHAQKKTKQILAKMLSYPVLGIAISLFAGVIFLAADFQTVGISIIIIGILLTLVLTYAMYDELKDLVNKRRNTIIRQFPSVVSKLALLVTSGMIMDRAWKETANSGDDELYREMKKTSKELDNLVSPEVAYSNFINRCNTKESAKLASAIMQNLSKGNAEIGRLLKEMAREAWLERRHIAKRDAEKANSKLMIPTMLLFLAILVMLMVPVAMNFSGL